MEWNQVYAITGTVAAVGIGVGGLFMWYLSKLDSDIKNLSSSLLALNSSMNGWVQHLTAMQSEQSKRTDNQNQRLDQLYNMFIDLLKEGRK